MRRRGNKSAKVPNVKLRPAQPKHAGHKGVDINEEMPYAEPSSDSEVAPNASMVDLCPRPLRGVTICATGVLDKPTIFRKAFELGALTTSDFTDRVTHLIASAHGGAKYMCALERKIPIMLPEWITASYEVWLKGDDVDLKESLTNYRLPIFSGVTLCLTGIPLAARAQIQRMVVAHGGVYTKALERPVRVTHLLCSEADEDDGCSGVEVEVLAKAGDGGQGKGETGEIEITEKMRYAEKFNKRGEANISIVWEEWFWDSLEFGGRFDERKYQVSRPRPERKSLQEDPRAESVPLTNQQSLRNQPSTNAIIPSHITARAPIPNTNSSSDASAPAARPIADLDQDEEEIAALKPRVPAVTLHLWESLLKPRGFELEGGKLTRSPTKSQSRFTANETGVESTTGFANIAGAKADTNTGAKGLNRYENQPAKESIISSFRRANSFAASAKANEISIGRQPFRRTATFANNNINGNDNAAVAAPRVNAGTVTNGPEDAEGSGLGRLHGGWGQEMDPVPITETYGRDQASDLNLNSNKGAGPSASSTLFRGYRFRLLGEARSPSVRAAIEGGNGTIVDDDGDEVDFVVVRLISGSKLYKAELDESLRAKYRTECWLEHSVFLERICDPTENVAFVPLGIQLPVLGAERVHLSLSGLDQSEVCWVKRLLRALGINLAPTFSRRSTHLLCPSGTGAKFEKAKEWGIPVVEQGWLVEMARGGYMPSTESYLVGVHASDTDFGKLDNGNVEGDLKALPQKRDKGKGKEKESDVQMADITNNDPSEPPPPPIFAKKPGLLGDKHAVMQEPTILDITTNETSLFGKPNGPLVNTKYALTRTSLSPPPHEPPMSSSPPFDCANVDEEQSPNQHPAASPRIPSSKSPSPMKLPRSSASLHFSSSSAPNISPVRRQESAQEPASSDVARALQESIMSLLGKRQVSDEDPAANPRRGKRARPQPRSKVQSRQPSKDAILSPVRHGVLPIQSALVNNPDIYNELNLLDDVQPTDESMRVTYEDPEQQEERKRLLSLLAKGNNTGGGDSGSGVRSTKNLKTGGLVRKSTRMAGF
ncbi:hypothetical protein BJ138DRAFT_1071221 [Hygrophoropsis aurantiaca]|uniref:Uncharacterized protein n=1 Tax=Hygrophoropsis aurantiaca TaxID=72124 RepID=A0ACB8A291_9AGAM|nr:hypothetical protein BJ138DRAFT_1071221 [Hygrophoropsis aurantiaca]